MTVRIHQLPCLADNYGVLIHDSATGATAAIDAPDAAPILAALDTNGWQLSDILLTHHHAVRTLGASAVNCTIEVLPLVPVTPITCRACRD